MKHQQQVVEEVKIRHREETGELLAKTRAVRQKITEASGEWDAAEVISEIRHGK
jgi:hypothetical protein